MNNNKKESSNKILIEIGITDFEENNKYVTNKYL